MRIVKSASLRTIAIPLFLGTLAVALVVSTLSFRDLSSVLLAQPEVNDKVRHYKSAAGSAKVVYLKALNEFHQLPASDENRWLHAKKMWDSNNVGSQLKQQDTARVISSLWNPSLEDTDVKRLQRAENMYDNARRMFLSSTKHNERDWHVFSRNLDSFFAADIKLDLEQAKLDTDRQRLLKLFLPQTAFPSLAAKPQSQADLTKEAKVFVQHYVQPWNPKPQCARAETSVASSEFCHFLANCDSPVSSVHFFPHAAKSSVETVPKSFSFTGSGNAMTQRLKSLIAAEKSKTLNAELAREAHNDFAPQLDAELAPFNSWQVRINKRRMALYAREFGMSVVSALVDEHPPQHQSLRALEQGNTNPGFLMWSTATTASFGSTTAPAAHAKAGKTVNSKHAGGVQSLAQQRPERISQMLASPLQTYTGDCGEGGNGKLCKLGVYVGDTALAKSGDAQLPSDGLEDSYNAFSISKERETAANTVGGDFFGHVGDAPVTKQEVQAQRARPVKLMSVEHGQMLASPVLPIPSECKGKLCDLGVNVGDESMNRPMDAQVASDGLEDSYNFMTISPERETAGNTIGGDWFGHIGDAPVTKQEVQAQRARPVKLLSFKHGQMLASPVSQIPGGCTGKLCDLGVNVGDESMNRALDAQLPTDGLEDSYNFMTISPERETAGNTIGGDWFGHLGDAPVTKQEVQAQRAKRPAQLAASQSALEREWRA